MPSFSSMFRELSTLGQAKLKNPESKELADYVDSLEANTVISTLTEKLLTPEAPQALNYFLLGCSDKNTSQKKRLKVCQAVIKEVQSCEISNRSAVALISRIAQELGKFPTAHLVAVADACVSFIRSSTSDSHTSWKDLLPKVLSEVESHKEVEYAGVEMPGAEFKKRIVQVICSSSWNSAIIPSLAAMFIEIQLSEEEHQQVVNKLCSHFDKMSPQEIPPLIHQMLILCKNQHGITVFLSLQKYFNTKIYSRKDVPDDVDSITGVAETDSKELVDCESMVLYHVEEAAKLSRGCVSELLRYSRACVNTPEALLDPFLLATLLALATISAYEQQVMEVLKGAILRNAQEEERRTDSAWLRSLVPPPNDFNRVLVKLIQSNVCTRDKVLKGLVSLCVALLNVQATKGKESAAEVLWSYGRRSLVCLVKRHRQVARTVLQTLADNIITGQNVSQYTDCLVKLCNVAPLVVVDNLLILVRLLDFLGQLPVTVARRVIAAVLVLVRVNNKLRDTFILVLRKALFSREIETRKIAVTGFLQLLKVLKVKGLAALSQSEQSFSGPSVFTQICTEVHSQSHVASSSSNEAICLEVLGVLRRCFMQQAPVKICLYQGLYDALCRNPELCSSVLDSLLDHFNQFYQPDQSTLPPLDIDKAVTIQGADIVLQEPVSQLVFVMQLVALKAEEEFGEDESRSLDKLRSILDSLVTRYAQCDLLHFQLDEGTNFLDILPETLQLQETVRQTIGVYQALMAYVVGSWTPASDVQQGKKLLALFKAHNLLVDYVRNCKPAKKDAGAGKKDKDKIGGLKKAPMFKLPETVLDFASVFRLLTLLISEDVPWATDESIVEVRSRRPLLRYATQAALQVVQLSKAQLDICRSSTTLKAATGLAKLMYERCLKRYNEVSQFENEAAVTAMECFYELLSLLFTHCPELTSILAEIVGVAADKELAQQLKPLIKSFQQLLVDTVTHEDEEDTDSADKQLLQVILAALSLLSLKLPADHAVTVKLVDWLVDFAHKRSLPSLALTRSYLSLLLTLLSRDKAEAAILDSMAVQLSNLLGTVNDMDVEESPLSLSLVTTDSSSVTLPLLCASLSSRLDSVDWLLARLKAEAATVSLPSAADSPRSRREGILNREKSTVHQLGHCVNVLQSLSCVATPPGPCTEALCRVLSRCYTTLTSLTKHFTTKCSPQCLDYQNARFSKLVKLAGSHLSSQVADLILYIEDSAKDSKDKKVREAQVLSQARKQAIYIPRLVADLENFSKAVTLLSKKCKDESLSTNMKLTTTRDFRINTKKLQEVMRRNHEGDGEEEDLEVSRVQSTQASSSVVRGKENTIQGMPKSQRQRDEEEQSQPPSKKQRKK